MENKQQLLLSVWQEVGKHIRLDEALDRLFPLLCTHLPLEMFLVRHLDPAREIVETLAFKPDGIQIGSRDACGSGQVAQIESWLRAGEPWRGDWSGMREALPGLLPPSGVGDVIALPLGQRGFLLFVARRGRFAHADLNPVSALCEPMAALLANDRRLHELTTLREAAEADNRSLLARLGRQGIRDTIIGADSGLREVMERVALVGRSDTPVLIFGETGSGKEVVARALHKQSPRKQGPFLRVNCGAIPTELIDSELFGHERGSFTGAVSQRKGWFERANGGTLFLDEVGELSLAAQVRLLRILQDGTFQRVGGQRQLRVDVRVVAATHRDLGAMVQSGGFRPDLMYRLAVFPVRLPALRERPEDIPDLANHFALRAAQRLGLRPHPPDEQALSLLAAYPWPGNVRELAAVIERAAILGDGERLDVATALGVQPDVGQPEAVPARSDAGPFPTLNQAVTRHIEAALRQCQGKIEGAGGAARLLAVNPHTLRARMRKLGIDWAWFRMPRPPL